MGLLNLLAQAVPGLADTLEGGTPATANQEPTDVSGIEVEMPRKQLPAPAAAPPPIQRTPLANYNNQDDLSAIQKVAAAAPAGRGSGLGLSNIIGAKGTLRDVLQTLGDAFLIQSGNKPIHAEQRYREQIANASAGFQDDPGSAASRIAATGAPGAMDAAQTMFKAFQDNQIKSQNSEYLNNYRQGQLDDKAAGRITARLPVIQNMVSKATNKDEYLTQYNRAANMLKAVDPDAEPEDYGIVPPEDFEPGMYKGFGMNAKQEADVDLAGQRVDATNHATDSRAETARGAQATSRANTAARVGATVRGQNVASADRQAAIAERAAARVAKSPAAQKKGIPPVAPGVVQSLIKNPTPERMKAFDEYVGHPGAARAYLGKKK